MGVNIYIYIKNNGHLFLLPGIIFSYIYYFLFKITRPYHITWSSDIYLYKEKNN